MPYKGKFSPENPSKYVGDPTNIIYRSLWERRFMVFLDGNDSVAEWGSEEIVVPYKSPVDGRMRRYYPDFVVRYENKEGQIETRLIEVKPSDQCKPPKKRQRITKAYVNEVTRWGMNSAKWEAAEQYARSRGWKFQILTEKELFT